MDQEQFVTMLVVVLVVLGAAFIGMIVAGVYKGKNVADNLKRDDANPSWQLMGRVLEKNVEVQHEKGAYEYEYSIEWIIVECDNGERRKIRNVKPQEILIAVGDHGEFTLRGTTVYDFRRIID